MYKPNCRNIRIGRDTDGKKDGKKRYLEDLKIGATGSVGGEIGRKSKWREVDIALESLDVS